MKTNQKSHKKPIIDQNPVEAFRGIPSAISGSVVEDLLKPAVTKDLWEQLLGVDGSANEGKDHAKVSGELFEGQDLDLHALENEFGKTEHKAEAAIDYFREAVRGDERIVKENEYGLSRQINEIMAELKNLAKSSKELEVEFAQITVEDAPVKPGEYHLNFFEWVLAVIRSARLRVDESRSWLSLFSSKKAKKSYWSMFKKHGTTFGLSHERVVATQTG